METGLHDGALYFLIMLAVLVHGIRKDIMAIMMIVGLCV
jgi:hypothetical protein